MVDEEEERLRSRSRKRDLGAVPGLIRSQCPAGVPEAAGRR
ncbi:MAG: hypothetical protein ACLTW9_11680 [Enterocloster sp.]